MRPWAARKAAPLPRTRGEAALGRFTQKCLAPAPSGADSGSLQTATAAAFFEQPQSEVTELDAMVRFKEFTVRLSLVAVGACLAQACAGGDGSGQGDSFAEGDFVDDGDAIDGAGDALAAEGGQSIDEEGLELGTLEQQLGGSCGSTSSTVNSVFYYTTVPDHFPPDSAVALLAATAIGVPISATVGCAVFGVADMHDTCDAHDACYGTLGKSKSQCDDEARRSWRRECERTYDNISVEDGLLTFVTGGLAAPAVLAEQACRETCLVQAEAMHLAIAAAGQSAYDAAQFDASRPIVDPQGPIFF
jgi:hypothetical protein